MTDEEKRVYLKEAGMPWVYGFKTDTQEFPPMCGEELHNLYDLTVALEPMREKFGDLKVVLVQKEDK